MSGADGEDPIVSAFTPGYKRRTKTETEEGIENYSAVLNEMQARMEKMEVKYETQRWLWKTTHKRRSFTNEETNRQTDKRTNSYLFFTMAQ